MPAISDMMRVALAQYLIVVALAMLFAFVTGEQAAVSALIGGLAYAVPTTFFAGLLTAMRTLTRNATLNAVTLLLGEFVKILLVLLLMLLGAKYCEPLNWVAFLITLIAVANSYFIMLFRKQ